ncbi:MAG: hypothetical protein NTW03_03645 [Verrucomicrobia bacterium]|nr:hypothetical protein [Verrucomicrobiota bacterium]
MKDDPSNDKVTGAKTNHTKRKPSQTIASAGQKSNPKESGRTCKQARRSGVCGGWPSRPQKRANWQGRWKSSPALGVDERFCARGRALSEDSQTRLPKPSGAADLADSNGEERLATTNYRSVTSN